MKTEYVLLLYTQYTPQPQRQTSRHSKCLGKNFQSHGPKKQAGVAILKSNNIGFKVKINKKKQIRTFHNCHRKNSSRGYLNSEHLLPKYKGTFTPKRNITEAKITH